MTALAVALDVVGLALLLHAIVNGMLLRRPPRNRAVDVPVSILLPVRNEAARLQPTLESLLAQRGLSAVEVICYDDESTDTTRDVVDRTAGTRVRIISGPPPPDGWLGKPHACHHLAAAATGDILVFVDADVVLTPDAVAGAVQLMHDTGMSFVSPYPRQVAVSPLERLVQPLLQWSWLTFLPLRVAERSSRPSLAAANGQLLVVDAAAYRRAGGHAVVHDAIVEDVALARALVAVGAHGGFVDGRDVAQCRMYAGARAVVDGYAKSLWCAFGGVPGAVGVTLLLLITGVLPWLLVVVTPVAWPAAVGGVAGRLVTAIRAGNRPIVDAIAHPVSVLAFTALVAVSLSRHLRRRLTWKGRPVG